jgi:hypothetical protein
LDNQFNLNTVLGYFDDDEDKKTGWAARMRSVVNDLWLLSGKTVVVRQKGDNNTVVHYENSLPDDLKPLVICDASGRVRQTYPHWSKGRGDLVMLKSGAKTYSDLTIHIWRHSGSKNGWKEDPDLLIRGIVSTINSNPDDVSWSIVHHMVKKNSFEIDVPTRIKAKVKKPERLKFTHWLDEDYRATNQFKDISHVILAGTLFYDEPTYESFTRLSLGSAPEERLHPEQLKRIRSGEHAHHILQALCRGSVRKNDGRGGCFKCDAYVIASAHSGILGCLKMGPSFQGPRFSIGRQSRSS